MGGRGESIAIQLSWFIPRFVPEKFLFHPHGIGLSSLAIVVLISGLFNKERKERVLPFTIVVLLCFPMFTYLLNGGLYDKSKVWIPMIPVLCYLCVPYFNRLSRDEMGKVQKLLPYIIYLVLILCSFYTGEFHQYKPLIIVEGVITFVVFLLCCKFQKFTWILFYTVAVLLVAGFGINAKADQVVDRKLYEHVTSEEATEEIQKLLLEEDTAERGTDAEALDADEEETENASGMYRVEQFENNTVNAANLNRVHVLGQSLTSMYSSIYNPLYDELRRETFQLNQPYRNAMMQPTVDNPIFRQLMGVKYQIGDKVVSNARALPIIYATNQLMEVNEYDKLPFPKNQTALLQQAVVTDDKKTEGISANKAGVQEIPMELPDRNSKNLQIVKTVDGYEIHALRSTEVTLPISEEGEDDIFAMQFQVHNQQPNKDVRISVEHQTNCLSAANHVYANDHDTFTYVIDSSKDTVTMKLGEGDYELTDISGYSGNLVDTSNTDLCQHIF